MPMFSHFRLQNFCGNLIAAHVFDNKQLRLDHGDTRIIQTLIKRITCKRRLFETCHVDALGRVETDAGALVLESARPTP